MKIKETKKKRNERSKKERKARQIKQKNSSFLQQNFGKLEVIVTGNHKKIVVNKVEKNLLKQIGYKLWKFQQEFPELSQVNSEEILSEVISSILESGKYLFFLEVLPANLQGFATRNGIETRELKAWTGGVAKNFLLHCLTVNKRKAQYTKSLTTTNKNTLETARQLYFSSLSRKVNEIFKRLNSCKHLTLVELRKITGIEFLDSRRLKNLQKNLKKYNYYSNLIAM